MKKILVCVLSVLMILTMLASCSNVDGNDTDGTKETTGTKETVSSEETTGVNQSQGRDDVTSDVESSETSDSSTDVESESAESSKPEKDSSETSENMSETTGSDDVGSDDVGSDDVGGDDIGGEDSDNVEEEEKPQIPSTSSDGVEFALDAEGVGYTVVSLGDCTDTEIIIDTYNELPITGIADYAFFNCNTLKSVAISADVKKIGKKAFYSCDNLETLKFEDNGNLESVDKEAFAKCDKISNLYITDLKAWCGMEFATNASTSPKKLYVNGTQVTELSIPDGVESIGAYAFCGVEIEKLYIPEGVTSIGSSAFSHCLKLNSATIPSTVNSSSGSFFYGCNKLVEIINKANFSVTAPNFIESHTEESRLTEINGYVFYSTLNSNVNYLVGYKGNDTSLTLPENFNGENYEIHDYAFRNNKNITEVTIPDSVTVIGEYAFGNCENLKTVNMGKNVSKIEENAFSYCKSLVSIVIPDNVKTLYTGTFSGCNSLKSITLGSSLETIKSGTFDVSSINLIEVINRAYRLSINAGSTDYDNVALYAIEVHYGESKIVEKDGFLFYSAGNGVNYLVGYVGSNPTPTLPEKYKDADYVIHKSAFYCNNIITEITVPDGVVSIDDYSFSGCKNLNKVTLPNSVTSIGNNAFCGCTMLKTVNIPDGVKSIGDIAFGGCTMLKSITLPNGLESIGSQAFYGCINLNGITIPSSVQSVGSNSFSSSGFAEIINKSSLSLSVYNVDVHSGESKLIENNGFVFYVDGETRYLVGYNGDATKLVLPESCNGESYEIYQYAFYNNCDITEVVFSDGVTKIGMNAFTGCTALTEIVIPSSVTQIGSCAFEDCNALKSVTLKCNSGEIQIWAFRYCYNLETLIIENGITSIGKEAFLLCTNLTNVIVPDSVKSIGHGSFEGCDALLSFTMGDGVELVDQCAFRHCYSLTEVVIGSSVNLIEIQAFEGCELTSVEFKNPNGWYLARRLTDDSGTELPSDGLSNKATAAALLLEHHDYWKRNVQTLTE